MKTSELKNELLMYRLHADGVNASYSDAESLRRSATRLHRWHERLYDDTCIDDDSGIAYRHYGRGTMGPFQTVKTPNIGKIEEAKIKTICDSLNCHYYIQGNPRGATLYVSSSPIDHNGNRGICCDLD